MPVIIDKNRFTLETKNTAYVFDSAFGKYPLHRYYGKKDGQVESTRKCCAFSPYFSATGYEFVPDNDLLEYSGFDSGDFRASSLKIKNKNCIVLNSSTVAYIKRYCPGLNICVSPALIC